ncbi:MAG TPA: preprotein translocase subunit SecE [Armatimonadetes bacterium]|jgi:preprotein translocase subunit SecE|nr:preprotein translocase subunit SecE [Armatimonadota bacterium]
MATDIKQRNRFQGAGRFLSEVWGELKKVQWPNREELYGFTVMVIIAIIAVGIYVGLLDAVLSRISDFVFRLGV